MPFVGGFGTSLGVAGSDPFYVDAWDGGQSVTRVAQSAQHASTA